MEQADAAPNGNNGQAPDATDNANYFCEYAYLYHQMDMLEDSHRTGSYYSAIISNPACFENKVVLDVGAGTCILSIFAAKAGAKRVYAVEATDMAVRGRKIVEANGLSEVIQVLQGTVETVTLPCKVDVIVSEWMGYFLLRESMLDSVLVARDKFLKPGGSLFPSHATLYLAPMGPCKMLSDRAVSWEGEREHWDTFSDDMKKWYDTDFSCVSGEFMTEQRKYYCQTGVFANLAPKSLIGTAKPVLELNLATVTLEDLKDPKEPLRCCMRVVRDGNIEGFCGYFDTPFKGSESSPAEAEVTLSTAPSVGATTHWGQQIFGFYPPFKAKRGDLLECSMFIRRQQKNHRLLELETEFVLSSAVKDGASEVKERRKEMYFVD